MARQLYSQLKVDSLVGVGEKTNNLHALYLGVLTAAFFGPFESVLHFKWPFKVTPNLYYHSAPSL